MAKLDVTWVDGTATVHYIVNMHTSDQGKEETYNQLVLMFPRCNVIVSYLDGSIRTHIAPKKA